MGRGRPVAYEGNSVCLRGERKNGAAPYEADPGLPAHLGTMQTARDASAVRLKCIPPVKHIDPTRPDTPIVLVEVAARKLDFHVNRIR